jgi:hypothetical protein
VRLDRSPARVAAAMTELAASLRTVPRSGAILSASADRSTLHGPPRDLQPPAAAIDGLTDVVDAIDAALRAGLQPEESW